MCRAGFFPFNTESYNEDLVTKFNLFIYVERYMIWKLASEIKTPRSEIYCKFSDQTSTSIKCTLRRIVFSYACAV